MKKIMLVDNDRIVLKLMTKRLEKEGYQVATAADGLQALDILKEYTPDVMIVDLIMPHINGEMLCKIIRKMENLKDVYLIILSAIAAEEKIDLAQLGANACIAKGPFDETAKHILDILDQPVLSSAQCLTEEAVGVDSVYPRGITEELLSAKRHCEMILETITEGVLEINSNGRIIFANSKAISLVDMSREHLLGAYLWELFAEDNRKRVKDLMESAKGRPQMISEDDPVYLNRFQVTINILPLDEDGATSIVIIKDLSEQKRAERALREANKFLKNILDSSFSISIISTDLEQNILFWNKGAENIFGYKAEEVVGRQKIDILYHEDEQKRIDNEIRPLIMKDRKSSSFEVREVTKDGRTLWMSLNLSPRIDEKGHIIGILGVGEDISKRKQAEERLNREKVFSERIIASSVDGILAFDQSCNYTLWNPGMERISGKTSEEVIGKQAFDIFPFLKETGEDNFFFDALAGKTAIAKDRPYYVEETGQKGFFEGYYSPLLDESDKIIGGLAVIRDITERKQAEEALRESEEKYRSLVESTEDSIYLLDRDFKFLFLNNPYLLRLGMQMEQVLGASYSDFHPPDDTSDLQTKVKEVISTGKSLSYEHKSHRDNRYFLRTLSPVKKPGAETIAVTVVSKDISKHKRGEQELIDSRKQLRELSAYLQSVREQERTSIAREIHDDLGQVLTALKLDIRWLEKRLTKDEEPILNKIKVMTDLIDMGVERVQRIASELRPGLLDDLGICAAVEWQLTDFENRTGVKHEIAFDPQEITLNPDLSTTLFRIVQEALTNIARHANATMVKVSLTLKEDELLLTVADNGKGIDQQKISDPKAFGLLGMQERARHWNGRLTINGIQNKGTTISARIPLQK